jgi:3'-5' exoribonuclease
MDTPRRYIRDLAAGATVDQLFLVRDKDYRVTKSGSPYLVCTLCDKTGSIPTRMWQVTETLYNSIPVEGFLQVKGRVEDYRGSLQLVIDACRPWTADKVDLADFLSVSEHDVEAMWSELLEIMRSIKDPPLRLLVKKFVEDRELVAACKKCPAAMQMHHAFIGGLLEHTLNVARLAKAVLPLYPRVNADLVLAGIFLHDIGKTAELSAGLSMSYTDQGQLVGHITLAAVWVAQKAALVAADTGEPFPPRTVDLLQHLILSHHGQYEYGSPKLPMIPEAFMLHHLDNLDAKVYMTTGAIDRDPDPAGSFTAYLPQLGVRIYKHSDKLGDEGDSE